MVPSSSSGNLNSGGGGVGGPITGNIAPVSVVDSNSNNSSNTTSNQLLEEGGSVSSGGTANTESSITTEGDVTLNQSSALADELLAQTASGALGAEQQTAADSIEAQNELADKALSAAQDALAPPQNKLYLFLLGGGLLLGASVLGFIWIRKGQASA